MKDGLLISKTITAYGQYPYEIRLAVHLHRLGVGEEEFAQFCTENKELPEPAMLAIQNHLRDMDRKFYSPKQLAEIPEISE